MPQTQDTDVLVIGAGGAGLVAAIHAHKNGAKVKVITKEYPTRSQTCMAQGGINAALANVGEDSVEAHIQNTLKSAHGLGDETLISKMCSEAIEAVEWLDAIGVPFSRTEDGKIAQRKLGGASGIRACYAQDYTGLKILHTLYDQITALGTEVLNERFLLEILTNENGVSGVSVLNIRSGEVEVHKAKAVILATGGYSRVYDKNSTNSKASSGDGIAAAFRAGAKVSDMEYVQFHPTALKNSSVLISESARGAGGYLLNSKGERFVDELLPRDMVARAIDEQIRLGEDVFLDIRHLGKEFIEHELPQEAKLALLYEGVKAESELLPIRPVAHYTMGGIDVDANSMSSIKGLYAVGECSNVKVHGANRLGGNSLLELVVFGKSAALHACEYAKTIDEVSDLKMQDTFLQKLEAFSNEINFYEKKSYLGDLFCKKVGIVRNETGLQEVANEVEKLREQFHQMGVNDSSKEYNTNLVEFLEFRNILELSELIVMSALLRKESRGAHYREDFCEEVSAQGVNTVLDKESFVSKRGDI